MARAEGSAGHHLGHDQTGAKALGNFAEGAVGDSRHRRQEGTIPNRLLPYAQLAGILRQ